MGIISDTVFRKIVNDSSIVTPETFNSNFRIIFLEVSRKYLSKTF